MVLRCEKITREEYESSKFLASHIVIENPKNESYVVSYIDYEKNKRIDTVFKHLGDEFTKEVIERWKLLDMQKV